jgi:hypothetical protein
MTVQDVQWREKITGKLKERRRESENKCINGKKGTKISSVQKH